MKFLIKEISPSRKELRFTINSSNIGGINHLIFGTVQGNFDDGTLHSKYIPKELSQFYSEGPKAAHLRTMVAYLKDFIGSTGGYYDYILTVGVGSNVDNHIPIVNLVVDDINLIGLDSDTIPTILLKLSKPLPDSVGVMGEVIIEKQLIDIQEESIYFIPEQIKKIEPYGLDYDSQMVAEVGSNESCGLQTLFELQNLLVEKNQAFLEVTLDFC